MAKYTDPKCRLCRREGVKLYLKGARCFSPKCPIERRGGQVPGQHGKRQSRRLSDYGKQLREKQKAKRLYGVLEKQFRHYYERAVNSPGNTGTTLFQLLETRLDNAVYRMGLTPSRSVARQFINHGNALVNGKTVDIPSYQVKPGDVVTLSVKALANPLIKDALEAEPKFPAWVKRKGPVGKVERLPQRDEVEEEIAEQLIIEYYSR